MKKERNIILTLFLIFSIIANITTSFNYLNLITSESPFFNIYPVKTIVLFIGCMLGIVFDILILKWNKIGFYGALIGSLIVFFINMSFKEITFSQSLYGIYGLLILFILMQIKKNGVSTWTHIYNSKNLIKNNELVKEEKISQTLEVSDDVKDTEKEIEANKTEVDSHNKYIPKEKTEVVNDKFKTEKKEEIQSNTKNNITELSDDLTKLGELKEKGLLTEEEFNEQKKKLLKQ